MFKVYNKDNRTTPMAYFTPCSSVSIVKFEHVIPDWEARGGRERVHWEQVG